MKPKSNSVMATVKARLLAERELAGDLLDGRLTADELSQQLKSRRLLTYNVVLYLMEQAGAQAQMNTKLVLPLQIDGIQRLGDMLSHRALRNDTAQYIYMQAKDEYMVWLAKALSIIADHKPEAILYLLDFKATPYMKHQRADERMTFSIVETLPDSCRRKVAEAAKERRKLTTLFTKTQWQECKDIMHSSRDKRTVLTLEMGL